MVSLRDIRYREWLDEDSDLAAAMRHIIEAEDYLSEIDIIGVETSFKSRHSIIMETFYNQLACFRDELLEYIDNNPDVFDYVDNNGHTEDKKDSN